MPTEVFLPRLTQTMDRATVIEWLKNEGEPIQADEIIAVVETDKSAVELESPASGVLGQIVREVGAEVEIGETMGWILGEGESKTDLPAPAEKAPAPQPETRQVAPQPEARQVAAGKVMATPVARKLAAEHGIDLSAMTGTGPGGRVTKEDILNAVTEREGAKTPQGESRIVKLTGMRKAIARRMAASAHTSAPSQLSVEVNFTGTDAARRRFLEENKGPDAERLTLTHFVCWATVQALEVHPGLNGWVDDEQIEYVSDIDLGFAVGLGDGLMVPVLKDAGAVSLPEMAKRLNGMARRARERRLSAEEASSSTFTVSSLGGQGIDIFSPILNPPEIGILGVGRAKQRVVIENGWPVPGLTGFLTLVFDHRAIDGDQGAAFLDTLRGTLEKADYAL